ncbi:hypothetical protein CN378_17475 [Bacillus sp. AFS015802]|uniref:hypothetical protein n=1 Tax=Bacillus sp. AFS015802 TaxID=2033486 RepID=UPI000BF47DA8|nr:hypothetical protein [Bacillus sp. AFS015802]PFA62834.1 hypothetical protein CN378_17475 [Bacillus sp. AFS015802]
MKKSNKWMKSMVVTTALSFGLMSGGTFAQASGMDQAKGEEVKAEQAGHSQEDREKETRVKSETPVQSKAAENQQKAEKQKEEPKRNEHAGEKAESVKPDAKPSEEKKAETKQKPENRRVKSQASEHASETAVQHANGNSAVLSPAPAEGTPEQTEEPGEESEVVTESNEAEAEADYVYGSDSASTANPEGQDFYIGKLGYGSKVQFDTTTGGGIYFSSDRAEEATYLYGYWFLSGMQIAPDGISPIEWGEKQAALALETYEAMKSVYGSKVRPVIFIDVEPAYTGMDSYDYANNQLIYSAFIDYLTKYGEGIKPGTYSSPWSWEVSMGEYSPNTPGAYWVAYYPMDMPTDLTTDNSEWLEFPGTDEQAEIWQYYGGQDDYNVAWMLP